MLYESSYYGTVQFGDVIEHHGIKGMKWGIRRYQNPDGSLTSAGMKRYNKMNKKGKLKFEHLPDSDKKRAVSDAEKEVDVAQKEYDDYENAFYKDDKEFTKYTTKSAKIAWSKDKDRLKKYGWTEKEYVDWYLNDDGDQGEMTGADYYMQEKHPDVVKRYSDATAKSVQATKDYAKELFKSDDPYSVNIIEIAKMRSRKWAARR